MYPPKQGVVMFVLACFGGLVSFNLLDLSQEHLKCSFARHMEHVVKVHLDRAKPTFDEHFLQYHDVCATVSVTKWVKHFQAAVQIHARAERFLGASRSLVLVKAHGRRKKQGGDRGKCTEGSPLFIWTSARHRESVSSATIHNHPCAPWNTHPS